MIEIVPAILTDDPAELERLLRELKDAGATRIHLDILDDTLVPGRTVSGHAELAGRDLGMKLDVHLMVRDPEHYVDHWAMVPSAGRFIVHVEATDMMPALADHCHGHGQELWAAINPDTPLGTLSGQQCALDGAMFMTVVPGRQGNPFRQDVLKNIDLFHRERPELPLMADGGITPATAPLCAAAGARILVSGSYVIGGGDVARAIRELEQAVIQ